MSRPDSPLRAVGPGSTSPSTPPLRRDLRSQDPLIAGLALSSLGNIGSEDMCRDLVPGVEGCLKSKNPYIRKKAALATIRILHRAPDLATSLVPRIIQLLTDGSHSVLLTGVTVIGHLLHLRPSYSKKFARLVPALCKILRKLASASFAGEYTIGGVTDPFLQAKILSLLRQLGQGNEEASDAMSDILATVATGTPVARNAGNAILYEAVRTMLAVEGDPSLCVLSVNILGRFLLHKDNNIRYVALQTLNTVVDREREHVAEHTPTVVECLRDPDVSIRRRALDLVVSLVDKDNVTTMVGEMLNYLIVADAESRGDLCSKIAVTASRFSPSLEWQANVLVAVLALAGDVANRAIFAQFIHLVTVAEADLQARIAHRLFAKTQADLRSPDLRLSLLQATVWCAGECGRMLLSEPPASTEDALTSGADMVDALIGGGVSAHTQAEVAGLLKGLLEHHMADVDTKGMVLSAALKLTPHFTEAEAAGLLRETLHALRGSLNTELQQRAVEFSCIADASLLPASLHTSLVARIPALDSAMLAARSGIVFDSSTAGMATMDTAAASKGDVEATAAAAAAAASAAGGPEQPTAATVEDDLFDLLGMGGGGVATPSPGLPTASPAASEDLDDLFGPTPTAATPAPAPATVPSPPVMDGGLDDLFGRAPAAAPPAPPQAEAAAAYGPVTLMEDAAAGLRVTATFTELGAKGGPEVEANATFYNTSQLPMTGVVLQVAVPRGMTCKMGPAAGGTLAPGGTASQSMVISNPQRGTKALALKVRVQYTPAGSAQQVHTGAVRGLPGGL